MRKLRHKAAQEVVQDHTAVSRRGSPASPSLPQLLRPAPTPATIHREQHVHATRLRVPKKPAVLHT